MTAIRLFLISSLLFIPTLFAQQSDVRQQIDLPSSKLLMEPVPGETHATNSFPETLVLSPDGRYAVALNSGYGTAESSFKQSLVVMELASGRLEDFPDDRLPLHARQTYFSGLAFSAYGKRLYASMSSMSDPEGKKKSSSGNGIAVYSFEEGKIAPLRFLSIPLQPLGAGKIAAKLNKYLPVDKTIPFPAGLAVVLAANGGAEKILVADNLSDDALLLDAETGTVIHRFDLSVEKIVPGSYPYQVVVTRDGAHGYISLWNSSRVAELDLKSGSIVRMVPLAAPQTKTATGSHPSGLLLSPDEKHLYVALANADKIAVVECASGRVDHYLSAQLPGQSYGGNYPLAMAQSHDGKTLFAASATSNAVVVIDLEPPIKPVKPSADSPAGFIPTEWYPLALAVVGNDLLVTSGKGRGTGPNSIVKEKKAPGERNGHVYIATLLHGSIARINLMDLHRMLPAWTEEVLHSNRMKPAAAGAGPIAFAGGKNPIRHVIYIIKENRSYDQIFGDLKSGNLKVGNGDSSLTMYGEEITPNQHKLALQFGVLDNFYDSGEVSGNGHNWSTAAITSDYLEKTWQIGYRSSERNYDYEGEVNKRFPLEDDMPDVNEPGTGYLWTNAARHGLSYRHYGEFITSLWCDEEEDWLSPQEGTLGPSAKEKCARKTINKGETLPEHLGGGASPYPWAVPVLYRNLATKPELRGHFDPEYPDFNTEYPDQLRADEFLREFQQFVEARKTGKGSLLPNYVLLRLPADHTAGTRKNLPTPSAAIADNDLALGRVVEAVSRSEYWDDTAILVLEDDAQDGFDHVDAHRSIALVISKYSPGSLEKPFVDSSFYTTVSMIRTLEVLLGLPPMNNNDAHAPVMSSLFTGDGKQPAHTADFRNRDNGLIYQTNPAGAPGAKESAAMDLTRADQVDTARLNAILWRDRKGERPLPVVKHLIFPADEAMEKPQDEK